MDIAHKLPIEEIYNLDLKADKFISIGFSCKPAGILKECNLRTESYPFDYMMNYSLSTLIDYFENGFDDFFKEYEITGKHFKNYRVVDKRSGMTAIHHIPLDLPFDESYRNFIETMRNRFKRLCDALINSSCPCFLSNRRNAEKEILEFYIYMKNKFNNQPLLINIVNDSEHYISNPYPNIYHFHINDVHPDNAKGTPNPRKWLGNEPVWKRIIESIKLISN